MLIWICVRDTAVEAEQYQF